MKTITTTEHLKSIPAAERQHWYIPESITTIFPIHDNNEPLIDVKEYFKKNNLFILFAGDAADGKVYLRTGAAERLVLAVRTLLQRTNNECSLKIYDAFRPLSLQRKYFDQIKADISQKEGLEGKVLWERVTQFIADPDLCPPHSTGGTVDCTIVRIADGKELSMGTSVNTIDDKANTWHQAISGDDLKNREFLFRVMTDAGFVNLASEWWHYSFGDQYWALFSGKEYAHYGSIEKAPR